MIPLLVLLCLLGLMSLVSSVLVLFQRWEDRDGLDRLQGDVNRLLGLLVRQQQVQQEQESLIGQTWTPTPGDQARVEQILSAQGSRRQHARTGSDPFGSNAKLAP